MSETIKQHWETTVFNSDPRFPFVVIDNWYTPAEEMAVWKELDFYDTVPKDITDRAESKDGPVARYSNGESKSKAYRYYIENYYLKREISPILNCTYKQKSKEFHQLLLSECLPYGRSFSTTNRDSTFVSYYEDKDYYEPHFDTFMWTCLIWMVREPRIFEGGDLKINEPDVEVKLKNNRMIMFPSCFLHSVTPVKFNKKPERSGLGRYTITHFYYSVPGK